MEGARGGTQVERLIFHAVRAVDFRLAAIVYPESAATFERAAAVNSARTSRLADQIAMARGCSLGFDRMRHR